MAQVVTSTKIIAHRGCWGGEVSPNSYEAILISAEKGFGCEIDIRSLNSELVISHDQPTSKSEGVLEFKKICGIDFQGLLAINVKTDGLIDLIQKSSIKAKHMFFDMSFPEMVIYGNTELKIAPRVSEYENNLDLPFSFDYVWVDSFTSGGFEFMRGFLHNYPEKIFIFVSGELHRRDFYGDWKLFKEFNEHYGNVNFCTDYPEKLNEVLNGKH